MQVHNIQNTFKVFIEVSKGFLNDYTEYVPYPIKISELLDEQLDEVCLSVLKTNITSFKPLAKVQIIFYNSLGQENKTLNFFISSDNSEEYRAGSNLYNHELYLIEQTKWLERFIIPATGFVNPIARNITSESIPVSWQVTNDFLAVNNNGGVISIKNEGVYNKTVVQLTFETLLPKGDHNLITNDFNGNRIETPVYNVKESDGSITNAYVPLLPAYYPMSDGGYVGIFSDFTPFYGTFLGLGGMVVKQLSRTVSFNNKYIYGDMDNAVTTDGNGMSTAIVQTLPFGGKESIESGVYTITYSIKYNFPDAESSQTSDRTTTVIARVYVGIKDTSGSTIINAPPKWNIKSVIDRLLLRAETLKDGDTPRFKLNAEQAAELEKIDAPEFYIPDGTLREALRIIGSYIHAEPRLNGDIIYFDKLGQNKESNILSPNTVYVKQSRQNSIEQFSTSISSTVDNIASSVDYKVGAVVEPYNGMYKTVRTENINARIQDDNMLIETDYPIQTVLALKCCIPIGTSGSNDVHNYKVFDITKYVFESADYLRMNTYDNLYPISRACALYYTINEPNIRGLNFKHASLFGDATAEYAIINILHLAGVADTYITEIKKNYPLLMFNIEYSPVTGGKLRQSKTYTGTSYRPTETVYNQSANLIESQYYGEHLKGVIARLGNVSKTLTYIERKAYSPPKIGEIIVYNNKDYYITAVASEIQPYYSKYTIALSQDFNRYSDYISLNREKRLYEVSERHAYDSYINYRDYIVFSVNSKNLNDPSDKDKPFMLNLASNFIDKIVYNAEISNVSAAFVYTFDKNKNQVGANILSLRRYPIGNSVVFTFKFYDNFNAGSTVEYLETFSSVNGYFMEQSRYKDDYGNAEYMAVKFIYEYSITGLTGQAINADFATPNDRPLETTAALKYHKLYDETKQTSNLVSSKAPTGAIETYMNDPKNGLLHVSIGSTEIPTFTYQVDMVSDNENVIIGSAMSNVFGITQSKNRETALYYLPRRLNKFEKIVDIQGAVGDNAYANEYDGGKNFFKAYNPTGAEGKQSKYVYISGGFAPSLGKYKAWAIVDKETNELLIGENRDITPNDNIIISAKTCRNFY